jgi:hypothetical protein
MQLGMPLEERKKAYAGVGMSELVQKYQEAERKRDIPKMIALLDIIQTAPKPVAGPQTTVVQDAMAAVMPQPVQPVRPVQTAMTTPGIEGAVDAMAAQNAPQQLDMPAMMAAKGGLMDSGEKPARFFLGGQGTVAPYSSFSALPIEDVERMAMMGDPDAQKELSNRVRSNIRPAPVPGPGVGPTTPQVTDRFGPPGKIPAAPSAATPSAVPMPPNAGPAQPPSGIRGLINRVVDSPVARFAGKGAKALGIGTAAYELLSPTEANVGEDDMLAKTRMLQSMGGSLDPAVREAAQAEALLPRVSLSQWKAKYFPEAAAQDLAPAANLPLPGPGGPGAPRMPAFPLNFVDIKEKSVDEYLEEQAKFDKGLKEKEGIRGLAEIRADLEKMGKKGTERAAADKAAAQAAFKDEALLAAALAAPQFLKGRGLGQATARFSEAATPGLMGAMQSRKASIKEADKMARESEDKYKLAGLEMEKAQRAERRGDFDKAVGRKDKAMQLTIQASLEKYKADMSYAATMGYVDRILAKGLVDAATERVKGLQLNPDFRKLPPETQQRMIESILRGAVNQGGSQRPQIIDVPGQ